MLKKELMIPGSKIKMRDILKDGLGGVAGSDQKQGTLDYLDLMPSPGVADVFYKGNGRVMPGETVEVVRGPKKSYGINCAIVRTDAGDEGFVYWCSLRASADHI